MRSRHDAEFGECDWDEPDWIRESRERLRRAIADNDRRQIAAINAMVASNEAREAQAERERRENDPNLN